MGIHNITGIADSRVAYVCGNIIKQQGGQCLIVAPSFIGAKRLASDLAFFTDAKILLYPSDEETLIHFEAKSREPLMERLGILAKGSEDEVRAEARRVLAQKPDRFILAADCTVPADTPWANLRAAVDEAHRWG